MRATIERETKSVIVFRLAMSGILKKVREADEFTFAEEEVPRTHYIAWPHVSKREWTCAGDAVRARESGGSISGEKWISLRLDGNKFSKLMHRLRKGQTISDGFSRIIASTMVECTKQVMTDFGAVCGFTQSDEITVLIPPTTVNRKGEREPHMFGGRRQKLCSLAASTATAVFMRRLYTIVDDPEQYLARFDGRVGAYDTRDQAVEILLWRAYDARINGISDAVHQQRGKVPGAKQAFQRNTIEKLRWLEENSLLPLHPHQEAGTYLVRTRVYVDGRNWKTDEPERVLRMTILPVPGNLLTSFREDRLFPESAATP